MQTPLCSHGFVELKWHSSTSTEQSSPVQPCEHRQ